MPNKTQIKELGGWLAGEVGGAGGRSNGKHLE